MSSADPANDLGLCVRAWRERLSPAAAGLPDGGRRRTSGLRREEVAAMAGVSVDYLNRLEQGRASNPSAQVLASLARALRLTVDERDHLYRLAGHASPTPQLISHHLTPGVQRMIERLDDAAVSVYDAMWTVIAWNPTWAALMGDPSVLGDRDRNLLRRHFTGVPGRVVRESDEGVAEFERSAVADLRAAAGRYPDDGALRVLIDDLGRVSARFAELWAAADVAVRREDRKTIDHPEVGPITLDCDVLSVAQSDLRMVVYTAEPGSVDADKLALVRVVGLQHLDA
jgi:transcriptional regulator with XRE-family HTH domain